MDLDELTGPERALRQAFPRGDLVDLRTGEWGEDRAVRAEVVAALLRGAGPSEPGHTAAVRLAGARIDGPLDLAYADVPYLLSLMECALPARVNLYGSRIREVNLDGCELTGLEATLAAIDGSLRLVRCRCAGQIRLTGTRIRGGLLLQDAELAEPDGVALLANRLVVEDDVLCHRMSVSGNVRLAGARIGGMLSLDGAHLSDPRGRALTGFNLAVGARLTARDGFSAEGEVILARATVGEFDMSGSRLHNPGGNALRADGITVGGALHLADDFAATGTVRLTRACIGGPLNLDEARRLSGGGGRPALVCRHAEARELRLRPVEPIEGAVDLTHARFDVVHDDPATWPAELTLDGLAYRALEPPLPARRRLDWLRRDPAGYVPWAYEQLAATYRALGDDAGARTVLLAKQRHRRQHLPWYTRAWGWFQEVTVGYGYRPLRAAGWFALLVVLGTASFARHHPPPAPDGTPPAFNPLVYTLDVLLPVVDLGQEHAYDPQGAQRWLGYLLILTGWLLASTIAAGVIRVLRRD